MRMNRPDAHVPTADHRTMAALALPPLSARPSLAPPHEATPPSMISLVPGLYLAHRKAPAAVVPKPAVAEEQGAPAVGNGSAAAAGGGKRAVQRRWGRRGGVVG